MATTRPKGLLNNPALRKPAAEDFVPRSKQVQIWFDALPKADPLECALQIKAALTNVNALDVSDKHRLHFLETVADTVEKFLPILSVHYLDRSFPLSPKSQSSADLVIGLNQEMALGYKILIESLWTRKLNIVTKKTVTLYLARAISYLSNALLECFKTYQNHPENSWMQIHQMYLYAEENALETLPVVRESPKSNATKTTIGEQYRTILLLGLLNPYRLRQTDTSQIFEALQSWNNLCRLLPADRYSTNSEQVLVKLNSDALPGYHFTDNVINRVHTRALDTSALTDSIRELLAQPPAGLALTATAQLPGDILKLLLTTWSGKAKRTAARNRGDSIYHTSVGIAATYHWLCVQRQQDTQKLIHGDPARLFRTLLSLDAPDYTPIIDGTEPKLDRTPQKEPSAAFLETSRPTTNTLDVWNPTAVNKMQYNQIQRLAKTQKNTQRALGPLRFENINVSNDELCLIGHLHHQPGIAKLQVGELVGLKGEHDSNIGLGVIRRIHNQSPKQELGIVKLSTYADAVAIEIQNSDYRDTPRYLPALLVPEFSDSIGSVTLLVAGTYKIGKNLLINKRGYRLLVRLTRLFDTDGIFQRYEVDVVKAFGFDSKPQIGENKLYSSKDSMWTLI